MSDVALTHRLSFNGMLI